jgi:DNA polymerase-3 subunit alpha (Gram-positive type)
MTTRMIKFLASIGIENTLDFDIDFVSISKNTETNTWQYVIRKASAWDYDLLSYFNEHLETITYNFKITYNYPKNISSEDIFSLFVSFCSERGRNDISLKCRQNDGILICKELENDDTQHLINDFNSLLMSINYPSVNIEFGDFEKCDPVEEDNESKEDAENESLFSTEGEVSDINEPDEEYMKEESNSGDFANDDIDKDIAEDVKKAGEKIIKQKEFYDTLREGLINPERFRYMSLDDINTEKLNIISSATVFAIDEGKETRNGKMRYIIGIHSGHSSFNLVVMTGKNISNDLVGEIKRGTNITFTGYTRIDKFSHNDLIISAESIRIDPPTPLRDDPETEKRVELHLHTNFSAMDGIPDIASYCKLASHMGMKAIAVTDHGVVQSYPAAQNAAKANNLKLIYGCELYVVDDNFQIVYKPNDTYMKDATYVVYDLETSGLSMRYDSIIEFGGVKMKNGIIVDRLDILINPGFALSKITTKLTHITDEMLERAPHIEDVIDQILDFINGCVLVSHNLKFDYGFLKEALRRCNKGELQNSGIDTLALSRYLNPEAMYHNLGSLCHRNEVYYDTISAHRADYDADVLAKVWTCMLYKTLKTKTDDNQNIDNKFFTPLKDLRLNDIAFLKKERQHIQHSREYHIVVLCKNKAGLKDLYRLVSLSHIEFLGRVPCVPRSYLELYRSNLLLGSACQNGEVFTIASTGSAEDLDEAIKFYDYIEIQPLANYSNLVYSGSIASNDKLLVCLKAIIEAANRLNKPIVATGDCHYLNPEDKIFRDVYISAPGIGKTAHPLLEKRDAINPYPNPDQHFRSTREMLEAFSIFGKENAYNWVIKNSNMIADSCENFDCIVNQLFTPTIDNCDKLLVELCYKNAHNLYGDELPEVVATRLEKELHGIISAGYYVTYYIAYRIIKKAHEDGYIVGSRGSVGSSFAATMAEITEVNPLPPHYRCPHCKHFELYEGDEYFSGYDLPEKRCPVCGEVMIGDGQNIPFETFLGFNADKVPDIDLNFPPDYQSRAHNYTKVLLGEENVFRAGTISTASDKTAFGYAKGFLERAHKLTSHTSNAEISYIASGCMNVKRTTGQHPGGIVVIPRGYEVYDFTPVQYPADDIDATWKTTHFEFESIHDTLLKLDLLGHVDPQALKMLCDISHVKEADIPFNDRKVLSLFNSPAELHLLHNYLGVKNGALALPEFGTDFVRGLLDEAKPKSFADLLIISGLSHGTGVWRNNADQIIDSKIADLRGVIGCRDDIMTYLISKGVDKLKSFKIMEYVRKNKVGKPLKEEDIAEMKKHAVPDYFIESCKKIRYLFPKAHATAYVSNAVRVAWFKLYKPLEFYATFFSVRCDKYDWVPMYNGVDALIKRLAELDEMKKTERSTFTKTYEEVQKTLTIAIEMFDRGFKFENISLTKSDAQNFTIDYEHKSLIPPFKVIDGLGDSVANAIIAAREERPFTSIQDVVERGKINNTQLEIFRKLGILDDLNESDVEQLSLFDI